MIIYRADSYDCTFWLAAEQYLAAYCTEPAFLLWKDNPTVVIGRFQNIRREVDEAYLKENGICLVRRLSGGGAVYHDRGTLQYSYWLPGKSGTDISFAECSAPILASLRDMGLDASFSGRNDIVINGYKVAGTARQVLSNGIIHHGTMLFSADKDRLVRALTPDTDKLTAKGIESVRSRVVNISELMREPISAEEFYDRILEKNASVVDFSPEQLAVISEYKKKLDSWEWVYGENPKFEVSRSARFAGGSVTVSVLVQNGVLRDILLEGDFFALGDVDAFRAALRGVRFDRRSLEESAAKAGVNADGLLRGVTADELFSLIL